MKFEEILVIASLLTGLVWLIDAKLFKSRRLRAASGNSAGTKLSGYQEPLIVEYSRTFFPVLILVLLLRSFVAEPFRIPSGSMKPTLLVGDFILVNKFNYGLRLPIIGTTLVKVGKPKRGDVIVFRHHSQHKDLIKRVVGVPGDHVLYKDKVLYINNKPVELTSGELAQDGQVPAFHQHESLNNIDHDIYTYPSLVRDYYPFNDVIVPEDSYFVMGDNRDDSEDSRFWGFVVDQNIIGQAFATWLSWDWRDRFDVSIRWSRIGKVIK